ncbi:polysaccharide biosynthesis tyrosine autokinase [Thalassotalea litorea]|uniref:Polysaccharide biosynthesis tyrosine autokinase n=1 Tax=Thalassotalea litorea TaxID=2020715 RepID=A0A5R9IIG3_9GAMM|nr:polysaccharide biosynthesis tyrosine autokinase [Thalassotalea litorea]TLU65092.1 polysaccharide biosynthesis tyrosine autokinase [Thalassotalea litorea]
MNHSTKEKASQNTEAGHIVIQKLFGVLLDNKWQLSIITGVFVLIASIIATLQAPIYKANVLIQVEEKSNGIPGLDNMSEMFSQESSSDTEIQILKSRYVLGKTIEDLGLDVIVEPNYFPIIGKTFSRRHKATSIAAPIFGEKYAWGGESIAIEFFDISAAFQDVEITLIAGTNDKFQLFLDGQHIAEGTVGTALEVKELDLNLKVELLKARAHTEFSLMKKSKMQAILDIQSAINVQEMGKKTGIIQLTLLGENRRDISNILDSISQNYTSQNVRRLAAEAENSLSFLKEQLPEVLRDLNRSERALNDFKMQKESVDLSLETEALLDNLVNIESKINEMSIAEADISRRFTKEHPNYISFKKQQSDLIKERKRILDKTNSLPDIQQQLIALMRDFEVNQAIYLTLQNKTQELSIVKASTVGNVRVLDHAAVFPKPVKPRKLLMVVLSFIFGFIAAVGFVLARNAFNRGVTDPADFEDIGLNVYATIPLSESQAKFNLKQSFQKKLKSNKNRENNTGHLVAKDAPEDLSVEAIRGLRTSLHFAMLEAKNNIIMISGASPGVGKSFVSANLAAVLAQSGKRILIVDADMRKGYLQKYFGLKWDAGLSDILSTKCSVADAIKPSEISNLDVITRGAIPPNAAELLMSEEFEKFLEAVKSSYDFVLIDTPPILAVTDPAIIGRHAGTSLMLARFELNPLSEIAVAHERFELNGVDIKGIIFNGVEQKASTSHIYGNYTYSYSND